MMKIVALDLDGTLLNRDQTISQTTIEQLKRLYAGGAYIVIATGRPYQVVLELLEANNLLRGCPFPQVIISDERDVSFRRGDEFDPWEPWNSDRYREELDLLPTARAIAKNMARAHEAHFFVNNDFMQESRGYVEIISWTPEAAESLMVQLEPFARDTTVRIVRNSRLLALRSPNSGKGFVLERLALELAVKPEEVLAVGDSHNDFDMLSREFLPATTDNADRTIKDLVKQRDGYVASASFSLGVAEILSRIALDAETAPC